MPKSLASSLIASLYFISGRLSSSSSSRTRSSIKQMPIVQLSSNGHAAVFNDSKPIDIRSRESRSYYIRGDSLNPYIVFFNMHTLFETLPSMGLSMGMNTSLFQSTLQICSTIVNFTYFPLHLSGHGWHQCCKTGIEQSCKCASQITIIYDPIFTIMDLYFTDFSSALPLNLRTHSYGIS